MEQHKKKATIIAVANQKGGVGKTTTTISLAAALHHMGKRVLMVDFDPQASLTICQGIYFPDELPSTISDLVGREIMDESDDLDISEYIRNDHDVDYIPADLSLSAKEIQMVSATRREYILKSILSHFTDHYDYILIDCPPTLQILTVNALTAADRVLVPVQAEFLSVKGLEYLLTTIMSTKRKLNPDLQIMGALVTMVDTRNGYNGTVETEIRSHFGEAVPVLNSVIPVSITVSRGQERGKTVFELRRDNKVAAGYQQAAKELIAL